MKSRAANVRRLAWSYHECVIALDVPRAVRAHARYAAAMRCDGVTGGRTPAAASACNRSFRCRAGVCRNAQITIVHISAAPEKPSASSHSGKRTTVAARFTR
jgi:hypothetical protein